MNTQLMNTIGDYIELVEAYDQWCEQGQADNPDMGNWAHDDPRWQPIDEHNQEHHEKWIVLRGKMFDLNLAYCRKHYPSTANLVKHVQDTNPSKAAELLMDMYKSVKARTS